MSVKIYLNKYFNHKLLIDENYTYEQAVNDVKQKLRNRYEKKILKFNINIEYINDANNIPKLIHFTCKDKKNITDKVWIDCLQTYFRLYPDYKIIIYDDNDIYNIIQFFDKKNVDKIKNIKKGAILADVFRYLILYLRGGYYSDMDCFPIKRIDLLSNTQYHGDKNNNLYIYPKNYSLSNNECDFYSNPCDNCKLIKTDNYQSRIQKITYNCSGHKYINENTNIIVGYEFEKTWHHNLINSDHNNLWTHKKIGICQWFIGAKQNEKLFLKCYKWSLKNSQNIDYTNKETYHHNVINSTGPLFFTRSINEFIENNKEFKRFIIIK
jgi:mannosyltransferase OCH1-like enzyme